MDYLGQHIGYNAYYLDISKEDFTIVLPDKNWYCCAISNIDFNDTDSSLVEKFIRTAIERDILSWHGLGQFGQKLHLTFDLIMTKMEVDEKHSEIDVCTIGHESENIDNGFWCCFGTPSLPERADYDTVKLICVSFDGHNYKDKLKMLIERFNDHYLPNDDN